MKSPSTPNVGPGLPSVRQRGVTRLDFGRRCAGLGRSGLFLGGCLLAAATGRAQIVAWQLSSAAGSEVSVGATALQAGLNPATLTRGAGILATPVAGSYAANGWSTGSTTLAAAQAANEFFAFTVSAQSGYSVSLSTLLFSFGRTTGAPNNFQWQYSLDGFATAGVNLGSVITFNSIQSYGQGMDPIALSGIGALQSVSSNSQVSFRLYVYGATDSAGTVHFGYLEANELSLNGTVGTAIPEPAEFAGAFGMLALAGAIWRRRNAQKADGFRAQRSTHGTS